MGFVEAADSAAYCVSFTKHHYKCMLLKAGVLCGTQATNAWHAEPEAFS